MKILVSRLKYIGDIVLTTPVIESLREHFPESRICYLGDKDGVALLERNPFLDEIIPYDFGAPEIREELRIISSLRKEKFDIAIDLFGNPRSAIVIYLSGAATRIGGNFGWRGKTFTHPITIREKMTAVAFHLKYLEPLGIHDGYRAPRIFLSDEEKAQAGEYLSSLGVNGGSIKIGFQIGATWLAKIWPPEYFARLAESVAESFGAYPIVTYGPKDIPYLEKFAASVRVKFAAVPPETPKNLRKLAAVMSVCDAFVSNDTSTMHISAAVGTPTVGIFGPSDPETWFPYSGEFGHMAMKKDVDCCHLDHCKLKGEEYMRCMKSIKPDEILETLGQILRTRKRANR